MEKHGADGQQAGSSRERSTTHTNIEKLTQKATGNWNQKQNSKGEKCHKQYETRARAGLTQQVAQAEQQGRAGHGSRHTHTHKESEQRGQGGRNTHASSVLLDPTLTQKASFSPPHTHPQRPGWDLEWCREGKGLGSQRKGGGHKRGTPYSIKKVVAQLLS